MYISVNSIFICIKVWLASPFLLHKAYPFLIREGVVSILNEVGKNNKTNALKGLITLFDLNREWPDFKKLRIPSPFPLFCLLEPCSCGFFAHRELTQSHWPCPQCHMAMLLAPHPVSCDQSSLGFPCPYCKCRCLKRNPCA